LVLLGLALVVLPATATVTVTVTVWEWGWVWSDTYRHVLLGGIVPALHALTVRLDVLVRPLD